MDLKNLPFTDIYRKVRDHLYYNKMIETKNNSSFGFIYYGDPNFEFERKNNDTKVLTALFTESDVFIDVGANIGYYSLLAKKNNLKVVSIEPDSRNCSVLKRSILENKFDIELYETALSDHSGSAIIFGGRQGASLINGWGDIKNNYQNICSVNTLDNLFSTRFTQQKIVLKIDAEGAEFPILKGASELLKSNNNIVLYVEHGFNENFGSQINPNFKELFEFLFDLGYKAFTDIHYKNEVTINEVNEWLKNKKRDNDFINYIFKV